jgi:hypothetical protein
MEQTYITGLFTWTFVLHHVSGSVNCVHRHGSHPCLYYTGIEARYKYNTIT